MTALAVLLGAELDAPISRSRLPHDTARQVAKPTDFGGDQLVGLPSSLINGLLIVDHPGVTPRGSERKRPLPL